MFSSPCSRGPPPTLHACAPGDSPKSPGGFRIKSIFRHRIGLDGRASATAIRSSLRPREPDGFHQGPGYYDRSASSLMSRSRSATWISLAFSKIFSNAFAIVAS
jgi:hypothetical protein